MCEVYTTNGSSQNRSLRHIEKILGGNGYSTLLFKQKKKPEKRRSVLLCQSFAYCGQNVVSEDETLSSDIHRTCEFLFSTKLDTKIEMVIKQSCSITYCPS